MGGNPPGWHADTKRLGLMGSSYRARNRKVERAKRNGRAGGIRGLP